jgi:hypothetical protein
MAVELLTEAPPEAVDFIDLCPPGEGIRLRFHALHTLQGWFSAFGPG